MAAAAALRSPFAAWRSDEVRRAIAGGGDYEMPAALRSDKACLAGERGQLAQAAAGLLAARGDLAKATAAAGQARHEGYRR